MKNLLLEDVEYKIEETGFGTWRKYVYPTGELFEEFISNKKISGLPLIHYTRGRCPETGKRIIAKGIIAVGRLATGGIAIGHASAGIISIGQLGIGLFLGLGQCSTGLFAVGQLALAIIFGLGQIATGYIVIAQFGIGEYVLAQFGIGRYVWDTKKVSPIAKRFFLSIFKLVFG